MPEARIGIIGGSGLYDIEGFENIKRVRMDTPFGAPSDEPILGDLAGERVAFLPRHGKGHIRSPSEINSRANIYAMKSLGVEYILSVSAVGSMREKIKPRDIVIPDQLFDRTKGRINTFFEKGIVVHISFADPFCPTMISLLGEVCQEIGLNFHLGGTYLCMEGPQFSTRAESRIYRQWGVDVIGMTSLPEAKLAREAEICYATIAMVTDYDVWHEEDEDVTVEILIANMMKNVESVKRLLKRIIPELPRERRCPCANALQNAIITPREAISEEVKEKYKIIIGKYLD